MTNIKDVFWYESEIEELTLNNGLLIQNITKLQEKIEHNLRRIKELRILIYENPELIKDGE